MSQGSRVTDAVAYCARRNELRGAVRIVVQREPERFRWKKAVAGVNRAAGRLRGLDRMRIEEPIRELVLDLDDQVLQREVVLDARRGGVDLDRGELLPNYTLEQIRQISLLSGVDLSRISRYTKLPNDKVATVDTAAIAVVGRSLAESHRRRAHSLWLRVPDPDGPETLRLHHRIMLDRAERDRKESERWNEFSFKVLGSVEN